MRSAFQLILSLTVASAGAAATDEPTTPLAESKQQLKELQNSSAARKNGESLGGDLKGITPGLNLPAQAEAVPAAPGPAPEQEPTTKPGTGPNWLLDTYAQLEGKGAGVRRGKVDRLGRPDTGDVNGPIDRSDPHYLLKTYDKQAQLKNLAPASGNREAKGGRGVDPMTPYLQDWLAHSPIREVILGSFAQKNSNPYSGADTTAEAPDLLGHPGMAEDNAMALTFNSTAHTGGGSADNPYLHPLALTGGAEGGPSAVPAHIPAATPAANEDPAKPTAESTAAKSRSLSYKAPPAPADDDKKYFPQLKRF